MPYSTNIIKLLDKVEPAIREVLIEILGEIESQRKQWEESVTKTEFNELKAIVTELAEAQKETGERLGSLAKRVEELAEAQKRTEQRLNELAEAQKRTEQRLNELAEAQKRTEQRLNELAEAQKRTEQELRKLIGEHRKTREELGGLSHTVGYVLEDRAYIALPYLLKQDFGIEVEEIKRDFIEISPNRYEEINIVGRGKKNGTPIWILGECKTQLKKKDIDSFLKKVTRIEHLFPGEKLLIAVTYQTSPQVRNYTQQKGLKLYFSYQFNKIVKHYI